LGGKKEKKPIVQGEKARQPGDKNGNKFREKNTRGEGKQRIQKKDQLAAIRSSSSRKARCQ